MKMEKEIITRLQVIFRDVLDDEDMRITREMCAKDVEEWDSIAQLNIIIAVEKEFKVKFKIDEIVSLKNVGDMLDLIQARM